MTSSPSLPSPSPSEGQVPTSSEPNSKALVEAMASALFTNLVRIERELQGRYAVPISVPTSIGYAHLGASSFSTSAESVGFLRLGSGFRLCLLQGGNSIAATLDQLTLAGLVKVAQKLPQLLLALDKASAEAIAEAQRSYAVTDSVLLTLTGIDKRA